MRNLYKVIVYVSIVGTLNLFAKGDRAGFYLGALGGSTTFNTSAYETGIEEDLEDTITGIEIDVEATASTYSKIFLGYRFGDYFGLEYNQGSIGTLETTAEGTLLTLPTEIIVESELTYTAFDLIFFIPVNMLDIMLKVGSMTLGSSITTTTTVTGLATLDDETKTTAVDSGTRLGLGLMYHIGMVGLRFDYETFTIGSDGNNITVSTTGVGASINF